MRAASVGSSLALAASLAAPGSASAAAIYSYAARPPAGTARPVSRASVAPASRARAPRSPARAPASGHTRPPSASPRAPSAPPLGSPAAGGAGEEIPGVPSSGGDQLVENGLSSPLCEGSVTAALSASAQSDCRSSGFVAAPAPTNSYALDVHIDTGTLGLSNGELLSVIQDVFVAPVWGALVWVVHALLVMLEWGYTLEPLGGSTLSGVATALRRTQASFTDPWLALALAVAGMLALYDGLVRRRVAATLGQALTTLAMMAGGLWIVANPLGTVGAVGQWANQASLGTLGAVAQGTPSNASRTLADSMRALFDGAIAMPWCYLEFGNVRWCSAPSLLDPRLREAALSLATARWAKVGCAPSVSGPCTSAGNASALAVEHSDELVAQANTNGELFLAFPANEPQRNSVKESSSLLHVLCQSEDDTKCTGPTAAEAEFRSDGGTFPRMIGVVLIATGVLGMTLLFGLLAARLLLAAVFSLFLLLLAPFAVLAPAFGDGGRALFGGWATRLLGAVVSKLIFSFLLGALLTVQRLLTALPLGWWTQWLLISAFWWTVFLKRHQAAALARGQGPFAPRRRSAARRLEEAFETPRAVMHPVRWAKRKLLSPAPPDEQLRMPGQPEVGGGQGDELAANTDAPTPVHSRDPHGERRVEARLTGDRPVPERASPAVARDREPRERPVSHADVARATPPSDPPLAPAIQRESAHASEWADAGEHNAPSMDDARAVAEGRKRQLGWGPER